MLFVVVASPDKIVSRFIWLSCSPCFLYSLYLFNFLFVVVLVSSEEALSKGFRNEGSFFLETKSQSSSLGSGLDQLDQEPNALRTPRHKASRSVRELSYPVNIISGQLLSLKQR